MRSSASTWARAAISGTTPPKAACSVTCDSTILDRILPWPSPARSTTAAAVSSQVVSIPSTSMGVLLTHDRPRAFARSRGAIHPASSCGSARAAARWRWRRRAWCARRWPQAHGFDPERIAIEVIRTSGDRIQDRPLAEAGGKGLFTKEIEEALLAGAIDLAVHSSKDMPTVLPPGWCCRPSCRARTRATPSSAARRSPSRELPRGATVGTASLRRQAMVKRLRPDLVDRAAARQRRDAAAQARRGRGRRDAAGAGRPEAARPRRRTRPRCSTSTNSCRRSGRAPSASRRAPTMRARATCWRAINHADTFSALAAERAFLAVLDGSCRTPIGGHATIAGGRLRFRGMIVKPDGSEAFEAAREGDVRRRRKARRRCRRRIEGPRRPDFFQRV